MYSFFFSSRRRHTRLQGDWSSDVCSSDLEQAATILALEALGERRVGDAGGVEPVALVGHVQSHGVARHLDPHEIGRASCRERVEISVGAVSLKKKKRQELAREQWPAEGQR